MKRMIPNKFIEWAKKLFNLVDVEGTTTQVGGNLEVDGGINCEPVDISIFALDEIGYDDETSTGTYRTIYSFEQIKNIVIKNRVNGFSQNNDFILRVTRINESLITMQWVEFASDLSVNTIIQYSFIKQEDGSCLAIKFEI